jgi:hypothetical protein
MGNASDQGELGQPRPLALGAMGCCVNENMPRRKSAKNTFDTIKKPAEKRSDRCASVERAGFVTRKNAAAGESVTKT